MLIGQILRSKGSDVATTTPTALVREVLTVLREHGVGALVVSADGEGIDGIISERDIVRSLARDGAECLDRSAADLMTAEVVTTDPSASTEDLMAIMSKGRFRHVPVVADGALAGIVSIGDIVKARVLELETEREQLTDYISGR